jgi:acetyl esterase/lipase
MSILDRTPPNPDHILPYGLLPPQFGQLWIPPTSNARTSASFPLNLNYANFLCAAMKALGVAVWSLEYRRVGDPGGGWPGTMQDVAAGMDHVLKLASDYPIDTSRIITAGHSAGGQLAFWLAARHHIPHTSLLAQTQPNVALKGVVALAGAVDLRLTIDLGGSFFGFTNGGPAVKALMGGSPAQVPDRYSAADPGELLPLGVPQILVQGTEDDQISPTLPTRWAQAARRQGDPVDVKMVPGADHFDVVDPESKAWSVSSDALLKLLHA